MTRVLVVGAVSWNLIVELGGPVPPAPATLFARSSWETLSATGAGKALNLARLGLATTLHAFVGDDSPGRRIAAELADAGVHARLGIDPVGTERHVNLMQPDGGRLSVYVQSPSPDPPVDVDELIGLAAAADHVAVNLAPYTRDLLPALASTGTPLWCDLHDWDGVADFHQPYADHADYLFFSAERLSDPVAVVRELAPGKRLVVCTRGADGAIGAGPDGRVVAVAAEPVERVVDTNGAGDAFFAGVLAAHAAGLELRELLTVGSRVAATALGTRAIANRELAPDAVGLG
jgi:acarbose 7IV-phosphotransferase